MKNITTVPFILSVYLIRYLGCEQTISVISVSTLALVVVWLSCNGCKVAMDLSSVRGKFDNEIPRGSHRTEAS